MLVRVLAICTLILLSSCGGGSDCDSGSAVLGKAHDDCSGEKVPAK